MYVYICMYIYVCMYVCMYVYAGVYRSEGNRQITSASNSSIFQGSTYSLTTYLLVFLVVSCVCCLFLKLLFKNIPSILNFRFDCLGRPMPNKIFCPCQLYIFKKFRCYLFSYISYTIWCETWSLTLREEHRLRVFENRILRRILGLKRVVNGE